MQKTLEEVLCQVFDMPCSDIVSHQLILNIYIYINHIEASENPRPRSTLNAARKVAVLNGNQMQAPFAGTTAARLKMLCLKRTRTQENAGK